MDERIAITNHKNSNRMSIWLNYSEDEKMVLLQQTAVARKISAEQAIEKDWWVTAILVALSKSSWADFLQFKGGTSLSKAWGLISRFSEDIDLTISRSFFDLPEETNQQRTKIRREAFHYIEEKLLPELDSILSSEGITGYKVELVTKNSSDIVDFKIYFLPLSHYAAVNNIIRNTNSSSCGTFYHQGCIFYVMHFYKASAILFTKSNENYKYRYSCTY